MSWSPILLASVPGEAESLGSANPVGFVIVARGGVYATDADEIQRKLRRRSKIYSEDTITTSDSAKVQIKFSDGSIIALREDSALRVDEFEFDKTGDNERSFFTLLKGGFRAISGSIGKNNADDYRVNTPLGTIGIRGTVYDAVLSDGLVMGVWQGGVNIKNEAGSLDLGLGADFNYCVVSALNEAPVGLLEAPAILINTSLSLSDNKEEESEAADKSDGEGGAEDASDVEEDGDEGIIGEGGEEGDRKAEEEAETASAETKNENREHDQKSERDDGAKSGNTVASGHRQEMTKRHKTSDGVGDGRRRINSLVRAGFDGGMDGPQIERGLVSNLLQSFPNLLPENFDINIFENELEEYFLSAEGTSNDLSIHANILNDQEIAAVDRLGLAVVGARPISLDGGGFKPLFSGAASDGSSGNPFILDKTVLPSSDEFGTVIPNFVLKSNGSPFQILGNVGSPIQPASVVFGRWNASAATPALVYPNMLDSTSSINVENTVYWLTALPMNTTQLGSINGMVNYNITDFVAGSASQGNIIELMMAVNVDFASTNNLVNGYMGIATGASFVQQQNNFVDFWDIFFTGTVADGVLNVQLDAMSERNEMPGVVGGLTGLITGVGDGYLAGGFRFWQIDSAGGNIEWVSGLFGVGQGETRVTDAEITAIKNENRIALLAIDSARQFGFLDPIAGRDIAIFGGLSDSSATSPTILGIQHGPVDGGFDMAGLGEVINLNNSATIDAIINPAVDNTGFSASLNLPAGFNYGVWNGNDNPVEFQVDPLDNTDIIAVDAPIFWLSTPMVNDATLAAATGTVIYDNILLLDGNGSAGPLIGQNSAFGLGIDFSSSTVIGGFMELWSGDSTNQQVWVINDIQGDVAANGIVELWPGGMGVNTFSCINFTDCQTPEGAYAELAATLSDDNLVSLSGVYQFLSLSDATQYMSGIFSLYHETRFAPSLTQFTAEAFLVMQGETAFGLNRYADSVDVEVFNAEAFRQFPLGGQLQTLVLREHEVHPFGAVMKMGSATLTDDSHDSVKIGSRIDWGRWDSAVGTSEVLLNPADVNEKVNVDKDSYWIVGELTDPMIIQSMTGSFTYAQVEGFVGSIHGIPLDSLFMNVDVNFTNASFSGSMSATASSSMVGIDFTGNIFDAHMDFNSVTATLDAQTANADISAAFVGNSAQGIIGGFKASDLLDNTLTGEGVFFVAQ